MRRFAARDTFLVEAEIAPASALPAEGFDGVARLSRVVVTRSSGRGTRSAQKKTSAPQWCRGLGGEREPEADTPGGGCLTTHPL
jgi:hypothetical protein